MILTLHVLEDSKTSPTQPGRGIRKVVDLYHDLTVLLNKGRKKWTQDEMDQSDFIGMTEEEIEDEQKEYALTDDALMTRDLVVTNCTCYFFSSRKRCHTALKLLNTLIPGFEQKVDASDNTSHYCAPVSLTILHSFLLA